MAKQKENIKALHDNDLKGVLVIIDRWKSVMNHDEKCKFCESEISLDNLHSIFPESGDIKFVCDEPACIRDLFAYFDEKNYGK